MTTNNKYHGINTSFKRNGKFPIDADSLFSSLEKANEYLNVELTSAIPATIIGIYNEQDSSENGVYEVVKTERGLELFRLSRQDNNLTYDDLSSAVAQLNSEVRLLSNNQTQLRDDLVQQNQSLSQLIDSVKSEINDINQQISVYDPSIVSINEKISNILNILNNLQKQVDDDIEFWYGNGSPLPYQSGDEIISSEEGANVYPYTQWDEYESHVGDIYLNSIDGSAWRFVYQDNGYWIRIADELSGKVLQQIQQLYDLINATKELIPKNVSQLENDAGYLTEHQPLSEYAKISDVNAALDLKQDKGDYVLKNELPNFSTFALKTDIKEWLLNTTFLEYKTFVSNNYLLKTDITGYATQDWVNAQGFLKSFTIPDGYATQDWVNAQGFLKNFSIPDNYATQEWVNTQGFLKDFTIPDNYATKEWVLEKGYISSSEPVDLSNYALKDHTHDNYALKQHEHPQYSTTNHTHTQYALSDHTHDQYVLKDDLPNFDNYALKTDLPNLEGYATQAWVGQQGFITQLKTINGNLLIGTGNIEISTSNPVDLSNYALKDHTHDAYALKQHEHSQYATVNHNHTQYSLTDHTHSEYALKTDLPNLENYTTKTWISQQGFITQLKTINGISLIGTGDIEITSSGSIDLSNYALKDHTHDAYALKQHEHTEYAIANHTHQQYALSDHTHDNYALKTDLPNLDSYATKEWVGQQGFITQLKTINGINLVGSGNIQISSSETVDLSNYALKDHTHDTYALKQHEHSEYALTNHTHTQYALADHVHNNYALKTELPDLSNYALKTDIPSLEGYATQEWVNQQNFISSLKTINGNSLIGTGDIQISSSGPIDLSGYALKDHTHDIYALTEHTHDEYALKTELPSLEGYATQTWVQEQGFVTQLKTINGNSLIGNGDIQISESGSVDLSNYALKNHTHDYSNVYSAIGHTHINNTKFILKKTYPSYMSIQQLNENKPDRYNNIYWAASTGSHQINLYDDDELVHILEDGKALKWTINGHNNSNFVTIDNSKNSPVYLYFKCPKDGTNGQLYSSVTPINSNDSFYYFLFGVVLTQSDYIIVEDVRSGVRFVNSIVDVNHSALLKNDMTNYTNELNTNFTLG